MSSTKTPLRRYRANTFDITVFVRNAAKGKILESKFGVNSIVGDPSGLRKRHTKLGDLPIFIRTSGTGVLTDDARGEFASETVHSNLNVEQLKSIPPPTLHRNVDVLVVDADTQGYARTHSIFPSTIYDISQGTLFDARPRSTANGLASRAIGDALVELGIATDTEPTFTAEELVKYFGSESSGYYSGTNSRALADRSRSSGWKPEYTREDMLRSIKPEITAIQEKQQAGKA
ncbi:hypothetical protein BD413DRAFT_614675 [Trametes elegans]|nr:hypothetical protein BD413DRAFT_614675 [Trametes elegans]